MKITKPNTTPAPWIARINYTSTAFAVDSENPRAPFISDDILNENDAKMMAAAPDLAAALIEVLSMSGKKIELMKTGYLIAQKYPVSESVKVDADRFAVIVRALEKAGYKIDFQTTKEGNPATPVLVPVEERRFKTMTSAIIAASETSRANNRVPVVLVFDPSLRNYYLIKAGENHVKSPGDRVLATYIDGARY
jgi:hypothetical protein